MSKQFLVLGNPIEHSKSPAIHRAAYQVLGLDWTYGRLEVSKGGLRQVVDNAPDELFGFSVTMPLKEEAAKTAAWQDEFVQASGAANTLVRSESGWNAYNTDVFGIVQAIRSVGQESLETVGIVGSGATAFSAVLAAKAINPHARIRILARNRSTRAALIEFAKKQGLSASKAWGIKSLVRNSDLVISTLPGGALDGLVARIQPAQITAALLDVAYDPWPSAAARLWLAGGKPVVSGLEMLIWQAVAQLRIFTSGNPNEPLPNELAVVEAMRHAV